MSFGVDNPYFLLLMPLLLVAVFFFLRKNLIKLKKQRLIFLFLELFSIIFLIILASQPYIEMKSSSLENQRIQIFIDNSNSMSVFDVPEIDGRSFEILNIGENESSNIYGNIMSSLAEQGHGILITDGYKTSGPESSDLLALANSLNSTLYLLNLTQSKVESSVVILGPDKIMPNRDEKFLAKIGGTASGRLEVKVDGNSIYKGLAKDYPFSLRFSEGQHVLEARIDSEDLYINNNLYEKVIEVIEKPKILYVSEESDPIQNMLTQIYDVDLLNSPNSFSNVDLEKYSAVLFNDLSEPPGNLDGLQNFLIEGNGLFVLGGKFSFGENYKGAFEEILPVTITGLVQDQKQASIILVIDISGSTGQSFDTGSGNVVVDIEKAMALSIIDSLNDRNSVGAIAFNINSYLIAPPALLSSNRDVLNDKISRLEHSGGTKIAQALLAARSLLDTEGDIVLISDGRINQVQDLGDSLTVARNFADSGVKVHTISVGGKSDEIFLKQLSETGGGFFFKPEEYQKFSIVFSEKRDTNGRDRQNLVVLNDEHFITNGVSVDSSAGGYNDVKPKTLSDQLVTTTSNRPALTTWRYGIGRVATFTVFDGESLGNVLEKDNELIIRTINWVIGNPQRKMENFVDVQNGELGGKIKALVKKIGFLDERFSEIDEDLYFYEFEAEETGVHEFLGKKYSVTYPREYENFGVNEELYSLVDGTNGKVINVEDLSNLRNIVKDKVKEITLRKSLLNILLPISILSILATILARRFMENSIESDEDGN